MLPGGVASLVCALPGGVAPVDLLPGGVALVCVLPGGVTPVCLLPGGVCELSSDVAVVLHVSSIMTPSSIGSGKGGSSAINAFNMLSFISIRVTNPEGKRWS